MHRAHLHEALQSAVPADLVHLNRKLIGLDQQGDQVRLDFVDGSNASADLVVGADGVHSKLDRPAAHA